MELIPSLYVCSASPVSVALLEVSMEVLYFGLHKCSLQFFFITIMLPVLFLLSTNLDFGNRK